jgi:ABC-type nickel/cobalt efflux system permease component RcnA
LLASGVVPTPSRNPFGLTLREVSPNSTGFGALIVLLQAQFYAALTGAVQSMKAGNTAMTSLATVGFLYGIFHAAGPGHGKGVISAYIIANKRSLRGGAALSLAAALLQATVAIALVAVLAVLLNASAASINAAARGIELVSFAAISVMGLILLWSKAGQVSRVIGSDRPAAASELDSSEQSPALDRLDGWRGMAGVVLAAGIRPCSGAILLLVFSLSQGLFVAGIVGALAMALGTAITTGTLAALAVFAKGLLLRFAGNGERGVVVVACCETLAAAFVLILGVVLLTGLWAGLPSALD